MANKLLRRIAMNVANKHILKFQIKFQISGPGSNPFGMLSALDFAMKLSKDFNNGSYIEAACDGSQLITNIGLEANNEILQVVVKVLDYICTLNKTHR